jgi:rhodanese-related sulfurtransferase
MPWPWWFPFGRVPEIVPEELERRMAAGAVQLLDVRTRGEWRDSHIAGTINHPIQELPAKVSTLTLDKARPVVAICRSAHRSVPAVRLLQRAGYGDVVQLAGGMNAWWARELPTASAEDPDP